MKGAVSKKDTLYKRRVRRQITPDIYKSNHFIPRCNLDSLQKLRSDEEGCCDVFCNQC